MKKINGETTRLIYDDDSKKIRNKVRGHTQRTSGEIRDFQTPPLHIVQACPKP